MPAFLLSVIRFVRLLLSGHQAVAIENAALRLQLAAFRRKRKRPVLTFFDRLFWVGLSRVWRNWRGPLLYVQADTVVRWQRERCRKFWARLSRVDRRRGGRPTTAVEILCVAKTRSGCLTDKSWVQSGGTWVEIFAVGPPT